MSRFLRDDALTAIRPVLALDTDESNDLESFENATLRPIVELQEGVILKLARARRESFDPESDPRYLLRDGTLRDRLLGLVLGLLTDLEFSFYLENEEALNHRLVDLLARRIEDQLDYERAL